MAAALQKKFKSLRPGPVNALNYGFADQRDCRIGDWPHEATTFHATLGAPKRLFIWLSRQPGYKMNLQMS
jgi:hypothetical protein